MTVEKKLGDVSHRGVALTLVDLPGVYSLSVAGNALFQLFVADSITAAIVRSGFFFCVGLAFLGWLAERVTHSRLIGLGVFALLASDRELWIDAYSGMVDSQATFLLALHAAGLLFLPRTVKGGFVAGANEGPDRERLAAGLAHQGDRACVVSVTPVTHASAMLDSGRLDRSTGSREG